MPFKDDEGSPWIATPPLFCSSRLIVALMCAACTLCGTFATINLGMVIVCMEKSSSCNASFSIISNSSTFSNQTDCNSTDSQDEVVFWNKEEQSLLFGAFAYGGVGVQVAIGWLSDQYGKTKFQIILGCAILGVLSLISPILIMKASAPYYFAVRLIQGAAICSAFASVMPLVNRWITIREQGLMLSLSFAGYGLGNALTYPLSALLCEYGGWASIFYFSGFSTLSCCLAALFLVYDTPALHPRIGVIEKQYLLTATQTTTKRKTIIPWMKIVRSVPVWAAFMSYFLYYSAKIGTLVYLPLYLSEAVGLTVSENGIFSALPSAMSFVVLLILGPIFDATRKKKCLPDTVLRKIWHSIGTILPAIILFSVSQLDPAQNKYLVIALLTLANATSEAAISGGFVYCLLDLAPDFVGILYGLCVTALSAGGFLVPLAVSAIVQNGTSKEWNYVLILFACLYLSVTLVFVLFGSSKLQSWGKQKKFGEESCRIIRQEESLVAIT